MVDGKTSKNSTVKNLKQNHRYHYGSNVQCDAVLLFLVALHGLLPPGGGSISSIKHTEYGFLCCQVRGSTIESIGIIRKTYEHREPSPVLVDDSGNQVVEYTYDAWGKELSKTGTMATTLGYLNPFWYRGYVLDEETGLYYLRSRYYNPVWGRFVNADTRLGKEFGGLNLYTYCGNNLVNCFDPAGMAGKWVLNEIEYKYNGTMLDLHRADQGLPPIAYYMQSTKRPDKGGGTFVTKSNRCGVQVTTTLTYIPFSNINEHMGRACAS